MGIGGSIFLIAVGAILTWAVHFQVGWLDLRVVGYILMIAGVAGLILTMWFWNSSRRYPPVPVEREHPRRPTGRLTKHLVGPSPGRADDR